MALAATILAGFGALLAALFVVVYVRRRWWTTHTGRIMMTLVAVLAVLLSLRVVNRTLIDLPDFVWAAGYALLDAGLFGLLWLLLRGERPPPPNG